MNLFLICSTILLLLANLQTCLTHEIVFTPDFYVFSFYENMNISNSLGRIYVTSNVDVNPIYSTNSSLISISNSNDIYLQNQIEYEYSIGSVHFLRIGQYSGHTTFAEVILCVLDSNNNSPTQPTPDYLSIKMVGQSLDVGIIVRFNSTDDDYNLNGRVTFSLIQIGASNDNNMFNLSSDGILINVVGLSPRNYSIGVRASDGGSPSLFSDTTFILSVISDSLLLIEQNRFTSTVREDTSVGAVLATLTNDSNFQFVPANYLFYNATTREIILNSTLDYENQSEITIEIYNLNRTERIGEVIIYVINVVETSPMIFDTFPDRIPIFSVADSVVYCAVVNTTEDDAVLTYELNDDYVGLFRVDSNGIITLTRSLIYDSIPYEDYVVTLLATDRGMTSNTTINFFFNSTFVPLPSKPLNVTVVPDANSSLYILSWDQPAGIYPIEVFSRGLSYNITYFPLTNLNNVEIEETNSTSLTLSSGFVYLILIEAALLDDYGENAVISFATGIDYLTATTISTASILASWKELEYCDSDLHILYEIIYYSFLGELSFTYVNITNQIDNVSNISSCTPSSVLLNNLSSATTYFITLRVTIDELDVYRVFIAEVFNQTFVDDIIRKFPPYPVCLGEYAYIYCFLDENFYHVSFDPSVFFSFNDSNRLANEINNMNQTDNGINLQNYFYYGFELFAILDISNFSYEDSFIEFGCHYKIDNSNFSDAIFSTRFELAERLSKPNCARSSTNFDPNTCSLTLELSWEDVPSERNDTVYILKENGMIHASVNQSNTVYSYTTQILPASTFNLTLSASNCAGESELDLCYMRTIPDYIIKNDSLSLDFTHESGNLRLDWTLDMIPFNSTEDILIGYFIEIDYSYGSCPEFDAEFVDIVGRFNETVSLFSDSSNYTMNLYSPQDVSELSINASIQIVYLCGQNVTGHFPQEESFEYFLEVPPPNCSLSYFSINPFNCSILFGIDRDRQIGETSTDAVLYFTTATGDQPIAIYSDSDGYYFDDFRMIPPFTEYFYHMTATQCGVESNLSLCYTSIIPGYEFEQPSLSYSIETESIIILWEFQKIPESAADLPILLTVNFTLFVSIKFVNQADKMEYWDNSSTMIFSNETMSNIYLYLEGSRDEIIEEVEIKLSFRIVEQCGYQSLNEVFSFNEIFTCEDIGTCIIDSDGDGYPDNLGPCGPDIDSNGTCKDNCPSDFNTDQADCDENGIGDVCDTTCLLETDSIYNYTWPCTKGGATHYQPCHESDGNASRNCGIEGNWSIMINTTSCLSPEYALIKENITIQSLVLIAGFINETAPATTGDIGVIVGVLNTTVEAILKVPIVELKEIVSNTIVIVDFLADDSSQPIVKQSQDDTKVAQMVVGIMEQQASSLALKSDVDIKLDSGKNVFLEVQTVEAAESDDIVITATNIMTETADGQENPSVTVPIPEDLDPSKNLSVSVVVLKNIANLITNFADSITVGVGGLQLDAFTDFEIVSSMVSVQIFSGEKLLTTDGSNTVAEISIPLSISSYNLDLFYLKPSCLFLNDSSGTNATWFDFGIPDVSSDDIINGIVDCLPGHTTAFVVLVGVGNLESQTVVLNILSYIGCSLSVICLLISMTIYLIFGRKLLRKIYHFVHFQLALSLCFLYLAFLFGVEPAYANVWLYIPCKLVTVIVEYLLLVTFLWMLMEGIVVLIMIMWPFHQFTWKHFVLFTCASWIVPLIYVIPFIPFFHEYYISPPIGNSTVLTTTANYCFLHNDENTNLIYSVTAPLALIILLNVVILTIVIIRCIVLIVQQKSLSKLQRAQKTSLRLFRLLLVMFPVLGFGWSFGLLAIYFNTVVFAWLFTILCAFQGILYLFFVLLIRRDIQRSIVSALNLKSKFYTMQSRISSYYSKSVSTKGTTFDTKQTLVFEHPMYTPEPDLHTPPSQLKLDEFGTDKLAISEVVRADRTGSLPPTVELEEMLMFYEDRQLPRMEIEGKFDESENEDFFEKLYRDINDMSTQITEVDLD